MNLEDYDLEYDKTLTNEREEELIKKIKDQIVGSNIAVRNILEIGENDIEYIFIYGWLTKNKITISGINDNLKVFFEDHGDIKRMGINKFPEPLEDYEQQRLFIELNNMKKKGVDTDAKEYQDIRLKLIEHNIRLAIWTVGYKYSKKLIDYNFEKEDLEQMALEALINAVDEYDINSGKKFSTYAVQKIYYAIRNEWKNSSNNNEQLKKECQRLELFEEEMLKECNRQPTDEEIKKFLRIGDKRLEDLRKYIKYTSQESLNGLSKTDVELIINKLLDDDRIGEISRKPILDGIYIHDGDSNAVRNHTENAYDETEGFIMKEDLKKALEILKEKEKKILELRFGLEDGKQRTLKEVR